MSDNNSKELNNYLKIRKNLLESGYTENISCISVLKANILAFLTAGPFALIIFFIYLMIWRELYFQLTSFSPFLLTWIIAIISIPIHEFLHGFTWKVFCKNGWGSIHFGVMWSKLTPYCHCKEPLDIKNYLMGTIMPFLVLGLAVGILAIITGNPYILLLSVLNIVSAGGDTTIVFKLLEHIDKGNILVLDHPTKVGYVLYEKNAQYFIN